MRVERVIKVLDNYQQYLSLTVINCTGLLCEMFCLFLNVVWGYFLFLLRLLFCFLVFTTIGTISLLVVDIDIDIVIVVVIVVVVVIIVIVVDIWWGEQSIYCTCFQWGQVGSSFHRMATRNRFNSRARSNQGEFPWGGKETKQQEEITAFIYARRETERGNTYPQDPIVLSWFVLGPMITCKGKRKEMLLKERCCKVGRTTSISNDLR